MNFRDMVNARVAQLSNTAGYTPNRYNAPIYSSGGLTQAVASPYRQVGGIVRPDTGRPSTNPGSVDPSLAMTMRAGAGGDISRGAAAFMGAGANPWAMEWGNAEGEYRPGAAALDQQRHLLQVAQGLGIDTRQYDEGPGGMDIRGNRLGTPGRTLRDLWDKINTEFSDIVSVGGLSQGWSGGPANTTARTMYAERDGRLLPIEQPRFHGARSNNGFISRDAIAGLSLMLPMVGGWAGILGQGGAGTLNAGAGLGLTSSLPASAVNIGVNTLLSGRFNPMSLLGLVGGGGQYQSPMTSFQGALGSTGLGRSELGRGTALVRLLGSLAGRS